MRNGYALEAGNWKIEQDRNTFEVVLFKYEKEVERWIENRALSWEEMFSILAKKSYGGNN